VSFDTISYAVGLPDVDCGQVVFLIANQNVNARPNELSTLADFGPFSSGKGNPQSCPIHAVDQAHPFGVTVGHEDAYRERVGHLGNLKLSLQLLKFDNVTFDYGFGARNAVTIPAPAVAYIQSCIATLNAMAGVGLTIVGLFSLIDLYTYNNGFNSRH